MITWEIADMNIVSDSEMGFENFIHSIKFRCTASNDSKTADLNSSVILKFPNADTFIDINDVTEEQAMTWLFAALGEENKAAIEQSVTQRLDIPEPSQKSVKPSWLS
jgi:hypothetical protein